MPPTLRAVLPHRPPKRPRRPRRRQRAYLWRRAAGRWWLINLTDTTLVLDHRVIRRGGRAQLAPAATLHVPGAGWFRLQVANDGSLVVEAMPSHRPPRAGLLELDERDLEPITLGAD